MEWDKLHKNDLAVKMIREKRREIIRQLVEEKCPYRIGDKLEHYYYPSGKYQFTVDAITIVKDKEYFCWKLLGEMLFGKTVFSREVKTVRVGFENMTRWNTVLNRELITTKAKEKKFKGPIRVIR